MEDDIKTVLTCMIQQLKILPGVSSLLIQGEVVITINEEICFNIIFSKKKENSFEVYQKNVNRLLPDVDKDIKEHVNDWQSAQGKDSAKENACMDCTCMDSTCDRPLCGAANSEHNFSEAPSEGPNQTSLPVQFCNKLRKPELSLPSQQSSNEEKELTTVTKGISSQNSNGSGKADGSGNQKGNEEIYIKSKTRRQQLSSSELLLTQRNFTRRRTQSKTSETLVSDCLQTCLKTPSSSSSSSNNMGRVRKQANSCDNCSFVNSSVQKDEDGTAVPHNMSYTASHKNYSTSKNVTFNRHIKSRVQCEVCGKWLASLDSLKQHQRGLHHDVKPYKCKECGQAFSFRHSYKVHLQKHTGLRPFECSQCCTTYLTASHLKTHMISQHSGEGKWREPQFQCEICGRPFLWASNLKTHQLTHTDVRPFQCIVCSRGFTTKQALKFHAESYHEKERKFECDVCHKFYKSEHLRNLHKQRHLKADSRRFMCDTCGQRFLFRSNLEIHKQIHRDEKPHVCRVCGKGFKLKTSLYTHHYTHSEDTPFKCNVCSKAFKTKNCCKAHERRHQATKAFPCSVCQASFPDKGGLSKHARTVHRPTRLFLCTLCGKQGTRKDNMRTHLKSHWRDVQVDNPEDFIREASTDDGQQPRVSPSGN